MNTTTDSLDLSASHPDVNASRARPAFVIAWSRAEPERVGEVSVCAEGEHLLGRGEPLHDDERPRLEFRPHRPGPPARTRWLDGRGLSRRQLVLRIARDEISVERIGRCPLEHNGASVERAEVHPGDRLLLGNELLLFATTRRPLVAPLAHYSIDRAKVFGWPDQDGIVGEGPAAWALRDRLAFLAETDAHVLLSGPSGTGKELAARAIHAMSRRARKPLVARSAATFPESLVDAEIFGSARDYPNAGMPERLGLVGDADGSTLFLDEVSELPVALQAHLLRVLDAGGEYHRLGESRTRHSDVRVVAATNRPTAELRPDFAARFTLRCDLPALSERPEDLPLLARALVLRAAGRSPDVGTRFVQGWNGSSGEPRLDPKLVDSILEARDSLDVRELEALLWRAIEQSRGHYVELPSKQPIPAPRPTPAPRRDPAEHEIRTVLASVGGSQALAWPKLGLSSRHALYRLMKRYGIEPDAESAGANGDRRRDPE